jgi:hypothetical protein
MSYTRISSRVDTSDHGLPQLIKSQGPVDNGLTGVGEMSLPFHFELSGFISVLTHRGLKRPSSVESGGCTSKTVCPRVLICTFFLFSCGEFVPEIRPRIFVLHTLYNHSI